MRFQMTQKNNYEHIAITQSVNTISADAFPIEYPLHWHNFAEIIARPGTEKTGTAPTVSINGKTYDCKPGDILFIWPGELHSIENNPDTQLVGIQFPISLLTEIPDFLPYLHFFRGHDHIEMTEQSDLAQNMIAQIEHIISLRGTDNPFANVERIIALYEMFVHFGLHFGVKPPASADKTYEKIEQACLYIRDNCTQNITLDTVADYIGFSSCYFSRLFKQTTDYSFVDYLNLQRVKLAQLLLSDSTLNVTEISYQSGFKSISTFNRVFHQFKGCSPSEYRKYYSEDHS